MTSYNQKNYTNESISTTSDLITDSTDEAVDQLSTDNVISTEEVNDMIDKIKTIAGNIESNTNELICAVYEFQSNNGLIKTKLKTWSNFFAAHLKAYNLSKSTFYHCTEIAEFMIQKGITFDKENSSSLRAICSIKSKDNIRDTVWNQAKEESQTEIPPPDAIKKAYKKHMADDVNAVDQKIQEAYDSISQHEIYYIKERLKEFFDLTSGIIDAIQELKVSQVEQLLKMIENNLQKSNH